jgi:hypothetical protein
MPQEAAKAPELDVFAGGEPDPLLSEDLSGDRGDSLESVVANESAETPVVDRQKPVDEPQTPSETPEAAAAAPEAPAETPEAADHPDAGEPRIPKSRFDQVNERRKLAEQRLRELEAEIAASKQVQQPGVEFDFDAAEQKYMEAVVDGEFDKAKSIRTDIRNAERQTLANQALKLRDEATEGARKNLALDAEVARLQSEFPIFDQESESFDEVVTAEALDIYAGLVATGKYSPKDAIGKAATLVTKAHGIKSMVEPPAPPAAPARDTKPDINKKVEAASKQPPVKSLGAKSADGQRSVLEMSEDEFGSLPESTLRKLRGDIL